jgi:ADP-heptose:LPS heptosyltransferase
LRKPDLRAELPGVVVVHPGAAYGSKRWPPSRFGHIAAALRRDRHEVVITGTAAEQPIAQAVADKSDARVVRTSLPQLAALVPTPRWSFPGTPAWHTSPTRSARPR